MRGRVGYIDGGPTREALNWNINRSLIKSVRVTFYLKSSCYETVKVALKQSICVINGVNSKRATGLQELASRTSTNDESLFRIFFSVDSSCYFSVN